MIHGLAPVWDRHARVLILGSMPGADSLRLQQYYAHPRNAFWPIIRALLGVPTDTTYAQRLDALRGRGVALWDVLASCERAGSLDSRIRRGTETPNPIVEWLEQFLQLRMIVLNGRKAEASFERFMGAAIRARWPNLVILAVPSSSPAHAALRPMDKLHIWSRMLVALDTAGMESRSMAKKKLAAAPSRKAAKKAVKKAVKKAAKSLTRSTPKPAVKKKAIKSAPRKAVKKAAPQATKPTRKAVAKSPAKKKPVAKATKLAVKKVAKKVAKKASKPASARKIATQPLKRDADRKASAAKPVSRARPGKPAQKAPTPVTRPAARKKTVAAPGKPAAKPVATVPRKQASKPAAAAKRVSAPRVPPTPKRGEPKPRVKADPAAPKGSVYKQPLQKPEPWHFGGRLPHEYAFAGVKAQPDAERLAGKSRKVH